MVLQGSVFRRGAAVLVMVLFLAGSLECRAQSATAEISSSTVLPANTPVILRLKESLYKKDAKPGHPVQFEVGYDVVVNGQIFIQSGTVVNGSFRPVDHRGKGPAMVLIDPGPAETVSGEKVRLSRAGPTPKSDTASIMGAVGFVDEPMALPIVMPVLGVMTLFEKKVVLDKDAGCGWFGWLKGCGVWVVAHVAENVAPDPEKLKAAQAQYTAKQRAAEIEFCQLLQSRNSESSRDESAFLGFLVTSTTEFKARLLRQAGDLDAALEEYQQAVVPKPDCPGLREKVPAFSPASLHVGLAELFREKHDFVHAMSEYRTAVQLDPKDEPTREGFVTFLVESNDPEAALVEIKEAMVVWPDNIYFHYLLGRLLVKKNDPDAAIVELQWALRKWNNRSAQANCELGRAYELKGDLRAALDQYRTAYRAHLRDEQCRAVYERLRRQLKK